MAAAKRTNESDTRLEAMVATEDGFKISEVDLQIRGAGDFFGTKQSGIAEFKIADLARDTEILLSAREAAVELTERDARFETPDHEALGAYYKHYYADRYMPLAKIG
jgi:ATP-dependent DNA helicase RecG